MHLNMETSLVTAQSKRTTIGGIPIPGFRPQQE